jgi:hypothetical protein
LLIVGVLVSVLMVGVWSLFRTWSGLYERGERRVLRMQLVRSLCDQFTDDVHAATQVMSPRTSPDSTGIGSLPAVGGNAEMPAGGNMALMGEIDWLMLEVVQTANPWQVPGTKSDEPDSSAPADQAAMMSTPELRLVLYSFAPPASETSGSLSTAVAEMAAADDTETIVGESEQAEPLAGLLRLAIAREYLSAWSAAASSRADAASGADSPRAAVFWVRNEVTGGGQRGDPLRELRAPTVGRGSDTGNDANLLSSILERDEVPEVVWLEFRYFDGASWQSSWNSESQGRLPVAIEVRFELEVEDPVTTEDLPAGDDDSEFVEKRTPLAERNTIGRMDEAREMPMSDRATDLEGGDEGATPYHRCVVYLEPVRKK